MITRNEISYLKSLNKKHVRDQEKVFVAEGSKLVIDIIKSGGRVKNMYAVADWITENQLFIDIHSLGVIEVSIREMERITTQASISPIFAVFSQPELNGHDFSSKNILILDDIRDPGNLGTIIRTADWFGFKELVCSPQTVDCFNSKVIQSTMGSIMRVSIRYTSLAEFIELHRESYTYYGTFMNGTTLHPISYAKNSAFIIGNEAHGISKAVEELVNYRISIPGNQRADGIVGPESLNAAIATSVVLYDWFIKQ